MSFEEEQLLRICNAIDRFTELTGYVFSWLSVPLVGVIAYEVFARYGFDAPTSWAFELSYMLYGSMFMLGTALALRKGAHIRTDLFWHKFSPRTKGLIDLIGYLVFLFPGVIMVLWVGWEETLYSYDIMERSEATAWRPLMWPFKSMVPLSALLLLIQGVSEVIKAYHAVKTGELLTPTEEVQI